MKRDQYIRSLFARPVKLRSTGEFAAELVRCGNCGQIDPEKERLMQLIGEKIDQIYAETSRFNNRKLVTRG